MKKSITFTRGALVVTPWGLGVVLGMDGAAVEVAMEGRIVRWDPQVVRLVGDSGCAA